MFDITTVVSSAVVATIIGAFNTVGQRYLIRMLDHLEKVVKAKNNDKPKES
jgi:hypothetical protein